MEYVCDCGNTDDLDGFIPSDANGGEFPEGWDGDYMKCVDCGQVATQDEILGSE